MNRVADRLGATDGARGTVEGGEEPVAGGVDLLSPEPLELSAYRGVVALDHVAPRTVSERGSPFGGADDVGEHHGGEHTVGCRRFANSGQELLDLVEECVAVAD